MEFGHLESDDCRKAALITRTLISALITKVVIDNIRRNNQQF